MSVAQCFFMDDISTGLDSSTTYHIIKFLQQMAHVLDLTIVISLLQPAQEVFDLFDDVILLCEGQIAYQGPREHVLEFFESIGFKCPDRKNVANFLQEVWTTSCSFCINKCHYIHLCIVFQLNPKKLKLQSLRHSLCIASILHAKLSQK